MPRTDYTTVCPYLAVMDIEAQIEFILNVFNATIKEQLKTPDHNIQFAELKINETVIMIGKVSNTSNIKLSSNYVFVDNADNTFERAISNKAIEISKPEDKFYGIREAGFLDKAGNTWWIGQFLKDVSTIEMEEGLAKRQSAKAK